MKLYTRTGDLGQTGLATGERVLKDEARLEALGSIDELVAAIGVAKVELPQTMHGDALKTRLAAIQGELYLLLADIASTEDATLNFKSRLPGDVITLIEAVIDQMQADLPPLRDFVMPGDSRASAALHMARTICRRAERRVVSVARVFPLAERVPAYLNRLSDLLFVMARWIDHKAGNAHHILKNVT